MEKKKLLILLLQMVEALYYLIDFYIYGKSVEEICDHGVDSQLDL